MDIAQVARELGAADVRLIDERRGYATRLRCVEATFADERRERYWIKSYVGKPDDARMEWAFLQLRTTHGACALVEGVAYLPAFDAVVTRHVDGVRLAESMNANDVRRAGAWLGALHKNEHDEIHDVALLIDDVGRRLSLLGLDSSYLRPLRERAAAISANELRRVRTHGDFAPFNILVDGERMTIIDPSFEPSVARLENYCTRHEDYARFLICLGEAGFSEFAPAFRDGYKESSGVDAEDSFALTLLRVKYGLQALVDGWPRTVATARSRGIAAMLNEWS